MNFYFTIQRFKICDLHSTTVTKEIRLDIKIVIKNIISYGDELASELVTITIVTEVLIMVIVKDYKFNISK